MNRNSENITNAVEKLYKLATGSHSDPSIAANNETNSGEKRDEGKKPRPRRLFIKNYKNL